MALANVIGTRFNKLIAIECLGRFGKRNVKRYLCECDCGNKTEASLNNLKSEQVRSCGCLGKKNAATHDQSKTRFYKIWIGIKKRCNSKNHKTYKNYGALGIKLCKRWEKFENFYADMKEGYSEVLTIERVNNNKGYSKSNCRWATWKEQARNTRNNHFLEVNGEKMCLAEIQEKTGIHWATIKTRIYRLGWSIERAVTTPVDKKYHNRFVKWL